MIIRLQSQEIETTSSIDFRSMDGSSIKSDAGKTRNLKPILTQDLILWAFQVARGMAYITQRKVFIIRAYDLKHFSENLNIIKVYLNNK